MNNYSKKNNKKNVAKERRKRKKHKISTIFFRFFIILILVGGFAIFGALAGAYIGIIKNAPDIQADILRPTNFTSIIYDKDGNEIDRLNGSENREYVYFKDIPQHLKDAYISIEDERFYEHDGVDIQGLFRAAYTAVSSGFNRIEGASTITQQLIKNIRGLNRNDIKSKLEEQYMALKYEKDLIKLNNGDRKLSKDVILEIYMNTIGLHHGLNGVQTAAKYYFNVPVSELSLSESAVIAAITQNPSKFTPVNHPENNSIRAGLILNKMKSLGYITEDEYNTANQDLNLENGVYSRITQTINESSINVIHSYFVDDLIEDISTDLRDKYNWTPDQAINYIYNGGLKIYTTLDSDMQNIIDDAFLDDSLFPSNEYEINVQYLLSTKNEITGKITNHETSGVVSTFSDVDSFIQEQKSSLLTDDEDVIAENIIPVPQPQAAMIVIDYYTGHVRAMSGGRGEKLANRTFNRATSAERQPGSVFKVLASYAPAIDMGKITPATIIVDEPYTIKQFNNYSPDNWYTGYRGAKTVREGIQSSMNILAVKNLMQTTTIPVAWDYLINFGFSTLKDSDKVPSMALGGLTTGVTQKEVTAAMGAIANNGIYNKPILYTKIVDHDNKTTILENADSSRRVLKSASAYVLTDMMKSVMVSPGTGVTAKFRNVNMPIAGKTGTTTDDKDLTFVGYTPYYVSGIWLGFDTPKQMKKSTSSSHLVLWRTVMERIHENLPYKDFEEPDDITHATICTVSGELAIPGICDELNIARTEVFISGTEPKESCSYHMHNTPEPNLNNEDNSALSPDPKDIDDDNSPISTNPPSTAKPTPTQDYINPEPSSDQINNDSNGVEVYIPTQVSNKQDSFAYY